MLHGGISVSSLKVASYPTGSAQRNRIACHRARRAAAELPYNQRMLSGIRLRALSAAVTMWAALTPAAAETVWRPGEQLDFVVALGPIQEAASTRIETIPAVGEQPGRLRIRAEAAAGPLLEAIYPFRYLLLSTASIDGMTPLHTSRQMSENGETRLLSLRFDHAGGQVQIAENGAAELSSTAVIAPDTRDLLTALFHARSIAPRESASFTLFENHLYTVHLERQGVEELEVPAGRFKATRYAVITRSADKDPPVNGILLWISEDGRRLPLRFQATTLVGNLVAELTSWQAPAAED